MVMKLNHFLKKGVIGLRTKNILFKTDGDCSQLLRSDLMLNHFSHQMKIGIKRTTA